MDNTKIPEKTVDYKVGFFSLMMVSLIGLTQFSCKKLVDIDGPSGSISQTNVFTNDAAAIATLNGIYTRMSVNGPFTGSGSISMYAGLNADEFTLTSNTANNSQIGHYRNSLSVTKNPISGFEHWATLYNYVFNCNAAIEGLFSSKSDVMTPIVRQQLLGEAKFLRAFFYFYLVNLFGDIPLVLTTDPEVNALLPRSSKTAVYEQMVQDLKDAKELLSENFLDAGLLKNLQERTRPSKWAASSLLARVYLYYGDLTGNAINYANSEAEATLLITNKTLFDTVSLNKVFLKASLGNKEAIWQVQPTTVSSNTQEAPVYVIGTAGFNSNRPVYLSNFLLNNFESGDLRAKPKNWIDTITLLGTIYRFPYKYKLNLTDPAITATSGTTNMKEFLTMLRLGEQYLIRAEARSQLGNISEAQNDLNVIRKRAGLANTNANDKASLLAAVLHERQMELFSEFGHRWLDLKRTGKVDEVMSIVTPVKANGAAWQFCQQLYPLPLETINAAPNVKQNSCY